MGVAEWMQWVSLEIVVSALKAQGYVLAEQRHLWRQNASS